MYSCGCTMLVLDTGYGFRIFNPKLISFLLYLIASCKLYIDRYSELMMAFYASEMARLKVNNTIWNFKFVAAILIKYTKGTRPIIEGAEIGKFVGNQSE